MSTIQIKELETGKTCILKNAVLKIKSVSFDTTGAKFSYNYLCEGFDFIDPKHNFFKGWLRRKLIKYLVY